MFLLSQSHIMIFAHESVTLSLWEAIELVNYREILRLRSLGYSQRQIAASVHSARDTVSDVFRLTNMYNLAWPIDSAVTNGASHALFYPERTKKTNRKEPDYQYIHSELAKDGVTLTLLWSE